MEVTAEAGRAGKPSFVVPDLPLASPEARADGLPDQMAPLIFNAWYVIARRDDVGEALATITALGQPLVYYRASDGEPVVLDDRCVHRKFSLGKGKRKGDEIECGYHGFTYDRSGQCVWAPGMPVDENREKKLKFGVRAYPCAEHGPWLWVWMGDPALADAGDIPLPEMIDAPDSIILGYKHNPCNYLMLIENLLDLSHAHFLHQAMDLKNIGVVPEEAPAPPDAVAWHKTIDETAMELSAKLCGGDPNRLARGEDGQTQYGPSLTFGYMRREPLEGQNEPVNPEMTQVAHATTPVDERNSHQFFAMAMSSPFIMDKAEVLNLFENVVFEQDVEVLEVVQAYNDQDQRPGRVEFNMVYDRFGLKMRQILRDMKERERSAG